MSLRPKVIVIGLDGLEPTIVERMMADGDLPNLATVRQRGSYARVSTTSPAQTPVAWATFATGTNPGGHGIFDFIRRNPATYLPDLSLTRYEQKNAFLPPKAVNLRRGVPVWEVLSAAGIPSVVLRCPCTYPPDPVRGRMLAGVGVPDLRGGLGTSTFFTEAEGHEAREAEHLVRLHLEGDSAATALIGPRNQRTGADAACPIALHLQRHANRVVLRSDGTPSELTIELGRWSDWLNVKFKVGMFQAVRGLVRFYLVRLSPLELYASPVNFDPQAPPFPISTPPEYAAELAARIGPYYTAGMPEDHRGLSNGRFSETAYLDQCADVVRERERMMLHELDRFEEGFFFCLFDTPDRVQHMFWRFGEENHPANQGDVTREMREVIGEHYRACDRILGGVLRRVDDRTTFITLSDHGMTSFQRGVHINTWLESQGLLAFRPGSTQEEQSADFFRAVDWSRTKAYSLGLGAIYLNLRGREAQGVVAADDAASLRQSIAGALTGLADPVRSQVAIPSVAIRDAIYAGPYLDEAPDLLINFARGYRASWATTLGGAPPDLFEDNVRKWGGDHIIDPRLVPGVLFMNRPLANPAPSLLDLAPTILSVFEVDKTPAMEGQSLLS